MPSQPSAYWAHHSTETAITAVHDELARNIDSGKVLILVLLDLSATFNMVVGRPKNPIGSSVFD